MTSWIAAIITAVLNSLFGWVRSEEHDATNRQVGRLEQQNEDLRANAEADKKAEAAREGVRDEDFHNDIDRL